jgi:uncharacterized protein (DUF1330 family)
MTAYALAHVRSVELCAEIVEYLEKIESTMKPFDGRFVFHGGQKDVVEGAWDTDLILIEFPDLDAVRAWWHSPEYQAIKPLRTAHMAADIVLFDALPAGYRADETAAKLKTLL